MDHIPVPGSKSGMLGGREDQWTRSRFSVEGPGGRGLVRPVMVALDFLFSGERCSLRCDLMKVVGRQKSIRVKSYRPCG